MGAVTKVFKSAFGWNADQDRATHAQFIARGKDVEAIIDVLEKYSTHPECLNNLGPLDIWLEQLLEMAEVTMINLEPTLLLSAVSAFEEPRDKNAVVVQTNGPSAEPVDDGVWVGT